MSQIFINPKAVLFHEYLDKVNNYHTVVYNPVTETCLKINPIGYNILRAIDQNPDFPLLDIKEHKVKEFIAEMINQNVVFIK